MKTRYFFLCWVFLLIGSYASAQTIQGKIKDKESGEPIMFANVVLFKDGVQKTGTTTDFDGNYSLTGFDPGSYDIAVTYVGYKEMRQTGIRVSGSKTVPLDILMEPAGVTIDEVVIVAHKVPLIEADKTATGKTVTSEDINNLPTRDVGKIIATTAGVSQAKEGSEYSIRGGREGSEIVYVDGIRVRGSQVPAADIEQLQVITAGLPAQYGDVTSGVVNITTKGPSKDFNGSLDIETSQYLDPYGYNLINASIAGPIWKKKVTLPDNSEVIKPIIGYRLSGQFQHSKDASPQHSGAYQLTDAALQSIKDDPLVASGGLNPRAAFLTEDDYVFRKSRPNAEGWNANIVGKVDIQLSDAIDLSIGGNYRYSKTRSSDAASTRWLLNSERNPFRINTDWRVFGRLRHRISGNPLYMTEEEKKKATDSYIRNLYYTLQFDYTKNSFLRQDEVHKDNLFNYGYIGNFTKVWEERHTPGVYVHQGATVMGPGGLVTLNEGDSINTMVEVNPTRIVTGFDATNTTNPALADYILDYELPDGIVVDNGNISSALTNVYNLHTNYGWVYNLHQKFDRNQYSFSAKSGFELAKPGAKNQSKHNITFGFVYEQREDRQYQLNPFNLWQLAGQYMNAHLGRDLDNPEFVWNDITGELDSVKYGTAAGTPNTFDANVRAKFGVGATEYFNLDGVNPSDLSVDMFAANDLLSTGFSAIGLNYWGYDYAGNRLGGDVTFNDFFTATDANGNLTRPVAPFQPIYTAGYIQDKFTFRDIYFNVGVRVDRYDANQSVLKDPYLLYDTKTAAEATEFSHPTNISDDAYVYVDNIENPTQVQAYREGENWFDGTGTPVNDPKLIFGSTRPNPYLVGNTIPNIKNNDFDPSGSFTDYQPEIVVMPRIAFSFPISDDANFFAHYDVLSSRPSSNNLATALDYYYFTDLINSGGLNNPDLKPEKTIDYQVGFQQKVSDNSAIKMTAYYKELRDMVQVRQFNYAFPVSSYQTYGNEDFGTVKGFTFQYDLRRTGNVKLVVDYTLQFADGTGSDANSQRGTASRGNLRVIYPFNYDQRHSVAANLDYRYASGKTYNGPTVKGKQIFANAGINFLARLNSGRPYSKTSTPGQFDGSGVQGSLNGARLPWNYQIDMRMDKSFTVGGGDDSKGALGFNVYLRVQNLFNTGNILGVYDYTQSPHDDGFLASTAGQTIQANAISPESFEELYGLRLLQGGFFSVPRRIRLGVSMLF